MIRTPILSIVIITILSLFSSCVDKEEPAQITINDGCIEYFTRRMDFSSEGGSKTIMFSTNKDWTIHVSESGMNVDWCTITPSSGKAGDIEVSINVTGNTSYGERGVTLTLTAGEATEKLIVSQKQNSAILISSTLYEVPMEGGEIECSVKSNVNFNMEIPEQYSSWIHRSASSRALKSTDLKFVIDQNVDYEKRNGEILFTDGNITEVVKIYQAGGGILVLSKNEFDIPSDGELISIDLSSNFEYNYELPEVDWIKLNNGTRGMSSHTLYFEILPNDTYDNRNVEIRFFDPAGTVSEIVSIKQSQKDAIIISNKEFTVDAKKNFISVDINTNFDYDVIISSPYSSWIQVADNPLSRALDPYKLDLRILENTTYDSRFGKVVIKGKNSEISDTVYIEQSQNDAIFIGSSKNVNVSDEGGSVDINVSSNVDIELVYLQDWTHDIIKSRGLVTSSHTFVVEENETPYERTGTVVIKKLNSQLPSDTMYVHQEKGFLNLNVNNGNLQSLLESYDKYEIEKLRLKGTLNNIDWMCLKDLQNLEYLNIQEIPGDIPASFFKNNQSIREVWMPQNSEIIKSSTFEGSSIQRVYFSPILKNIEYRAFYECDQIQNIDLPETVEKIGICAFNGCYNSVFSKLPNCLQIVEESGLWSAKFNGTCIIIPDNMSNIGAYALAHCFDNTESILFNDKMPIFSAHSFEGADFKNVYIKSPTPPTVEAIYFGNRYLFVPIGSKSLYEAAPVWKDFMIIEEIDYDNFVISRSDQ